MRFPFFHTVAAKVLQMMGLVAVIMLLGCADGTRENARSVAELERGDRAAGDMADVAAPNIVMYLADDQDVTDYGCYGNAKVNTAAVDQLARDGIAFDAAFTGQAICAPSRAQLFTGQYPLKNGCFANHTPNKPNIGSVTHHMRRLGYDVVLAGKSHVKPQSVFDWDAEWAPVPKADVPRDYIPLAEIEAYFRKADGPFVMFIASKYPHGKYFNVAEPDADALKFHPFDDHLKGDAAYVKKRAGYYRSIAEDNRQLERVLALVDRHLDDNTLFIYSADHGVSGKFTLKDIGLRVPLVARWPGRIAPGTRSGQLVHYTDILPTLIDIAGGAPVPEMDGQSFLPLLLGEDAPIQSHVYGVRTNQNIINAHVFPSRMVRDTRYKYIRNFNALEVLDKNLGQSEAVNLFLRHGALLHETEPFEELYDLQTDPFEQTNLARDPALADIKARLAAQMFDWMEGQGDFLRDEFGHVPIITAPQFKLDRDSRFRAVAPELKDRLGPDDYLRVEHWETATAP